MLSRHNIWIALVAVGRPSVAFTGGAPKRGPYGIDEAGKGSLSSMHHGTRIYPQWHQKSGGKFLMEVDTCNEQVLQDI